jgi:hypothetical protein
VSTTSTNIASANNIESLVLPSDAGGGCWFAMRRYYARPWTTQQPIKAKKARHSTVTFGAAKEKPGIIIVLMLKLA